MKILSLSFMVLATALLSGTSFADENQGPGQRRLRGAQAEGQQRKGPGGQRGGDRDPAEMVARMMEQFDKDDDKMLNVAELTAMLTAMRERGGMQRAQGRGPGQAGGAGQGQAGGAGQGRGQRPGGQSGRPGQRRGRSGDGDEAAGGKRPKRPAAE